MSNFSQTQLSNFAVIGGLIVIVLNQFGVVLEKDQIVFVMAALWSIGFTAYNYWQRFKRGDLTLGGVRK